MTAWSVYTVYVTPLPSIMVANFPGVIINAINLVVIAWYSKSKARRYGILAALVAVEAAVFGIFIGVFATKPLEYAAATTGAIMASLNALFFMSPLRALFIAVSKLDVSAVPTTLSYVQLCQCVNWVRA